MVSMLDGENVHHGWWVNITKWWDRWLIWVRIFLHSWDWVVLCHEVNPQVHKPHHAGEHVDIHVTWSGASEEPHCHYGGTHWLIRLFILSCRDTNDYPQLHSPPGLSQSPQTQVGGAWRLVFWHWQLHCHFSGWSSRFIPLLSGSRSISAMGCH